MKKYITIALCLLLLITLAVPTFAAGETKMTITPSKTTVQRGETIDLTVKITGTTPFTSIVAELTFDETVFEYVSSEAATSSPMVDYDGVSIAVMSLSAVSYEGDLLTITLRAKNNAPIKTSAITGSASGNNGELTIAFAGTSVNINCQHDYPANWTKIDGEYHEKVCSKCQTSNKEKHTWNEGEPIDPATCTEPGEEKYTCLDGCGATKIVPIDAKGHAWSSDCDKECNNGCGLTRETSHDYPEEWITDTTSHWHQCSKCGDRKDNADHTPGPAATATSAQVCTECNYVLKQALGHEHTFGDEWVSDSESHWHRCKTPASPDCYEKGSKAPHDYDDDCDIDCNTCDYVRVAPHSYGEELQANANGHWTVCTICNARSELQPHTPGPEATEDTPQTCEDCNFIIKMPLTHVHDFGDTWHSDDESHWKSCTDPQCPEVSELTAHEWNEPVEMLEGGYQYTCAICGKELQLAELMPIEPTTPPTEPTQPGKVEIPGETEKKPAMTWKWAGIAAVVLLLIGAILLIIEFIRSRKTNMHGRFSK